MWQTDVIQYSKCSTESIIHYVVVSSSISKHLGLHNTLQTYMLGFRYIDVIIYYNMQCDKPPMAILMMWSNTTPDPPVLDQLWHSGMFKVSWKLWDVRILTPLGMKVSFRPNMTLRNMLVWPKDCIPQEWDDRCHVPGTMCKLPCYLCGTSRQVPWPTTPSTLTCSRIRWPCQLGTGRAYLGCHHPVDWRNAKVLDPYQDIHHRLPLDSIRIMSQPKPLIRDNGSTTCFSCHTQLCKLSLLFATNLYFLLV